VAQRKEIKEGQQVLILTDNGWRLGTVQVVHRDRHGPIGVVVDGKRYGVSQFKRS
jgi:hypothetical protein